MIIVNITLRVHPEKHLELRQTLVSMIAPIEKENGCLSYAVLFDIEDQNRFNLLAEWKTRDDFEQHIQSLRFGVLLGTKTLLSEPPRIEIHTISKSEGMEAVHALRGTKSVGLSSQINVNIVKKEL